MANEKRLIDANALKQMFDEREADDVEMYGGVHIIECFPADDAKEIVDQMPTVDAVEVVHAKWENVQNGKGCCSNCHRLDGIDNLATHCRYCGAKMDGERKDNDF